MSRPLQSPPAGVRAALALALLVLLLAPRPAAAAPTASVRIGLGGPGQGAIVPDHFVGLSVEWSLVERYMGERARPTFTNLLGNLDRGVLRIGGTSQDLMRFDPSAPNTDEVITAEDLASIRATLVATDAGEGERASWGTILGTAMSPPREARPFPLGPDHAAAFAAEGVRPTFPGDDARRYVAGIELGNEPDLSYDFEREPYLADWAAYADAVRPSGIGVIGPNTSEPIAPWRSIEARALPTRFFWEWPPILAAISPDLEANAGAFGAFATDHFYPMSRSCEPDPYRCATIERLLSEERMDNLEYEVHTHATEARRTGVAYRLEEMSSAANRGVEGVSDVAASAVWALDAMFSAACPQPPGAPAENADCAVGAIGVNFHNSEVRAFFSPEEGNAFYNAVRYDPTEAMGPPTPAPVYYAMLLFSRFAQGTEGLRAVEVTAEREGVDVKAWQVDAGESGRRVFVVNTGVEGATVGVDALTPRYELTRMSPHDPTGAGRTLTAPEVRIDGRSVAADGTWPGFAPETGARGEEGLSITLGAGEATVVSFEGGG